MKQEWIQVQIEKTVFEMTAKRNFRRFAFYSVLVRNNRSYFFSKDKSCFNWVCLKIIFWALFYFFCFASFSWSVPEKNDLLVSHLASYVNPKVQNEIIVEHKVSKIINGQNSRNSHFSKNGEKAYNASFAAQRVLPREVRRAFGFRGFLFDFSLRPNGKSWGEYFPPAFPSMHYFNESIPNKLIKRGLAEEELKAIGVLHDLRSQVIEKVMQQDADFLNRFSRQVLGKVFQSDSNKMQNFLKAYLIAFPDSSLSFKVGMDMESMATVYEACVVQGGEPFFENKRQKRFDRSMTKIVSRRGREKVLIDLLVRVVESGNLPLRNHPLFYSPFFETPAFLEIQKQTLKFIVEERGPHTKLLSHLFESGVHSYNTYPILAQIGALSGVPASERERSGYDFEYYPHRFVTYGFSTYPGAVKQKFPPATDSAIFHFTVLRAA